ncbi:MAG: hypothetical protein IJA58_01350, partial [Lachnospiraceae bacterium]|nr:hypothetical protein [Lachnospiraceae bacterium]
MKKIVAMLLAMVMVLSLVACGGKGSDDKTTAGNPNADLVGTYDVTLWVSEIAGVKELTEKQIDAFEAANPGIVINASIEGVPEGDT